MILSDKDIKRYLREGKIKIEPYPDEIQIQPASVDLRLGNKFRVFRHTKKAFIDPLRDNASDYSELIEISGKEAFILHPSEFALGITRERVEIPSNIVARVDGRSSLGRLAILVHATAGYIDPGFRGNITLELSNVGKMPIALYSGMRICQISFETLSSRAEIPYGDKRKKSKYQDQREPTSSKIHLDDELRGK